MSKHVCLVCPRHCQLEDGEVGYCKARAGKGDIIYSNRFGIITNLHTIPVEAVPLARFCPESRVLSVGSIGCNMACPYCINSQLFDPQESQIKIARLSPQELLKVALESKEKEGSIGIAYTSNEPLIGLEYVMATSKLAQENGLKTIVATNGFVEPKVMELVLPRIDAMNIDLKTFNPELYRRMGGLLECVQHNIKLAAQSCHVEVTIVVMPALNDSIEEIERIATWLKEVNPEIALHISRMIPSYKVKNVEPPSKKLIYELADAASDILDYVYTENC